jgi:basic membrane protein A
VPPYRVVFVADVAGMSSNADADAYRGVQQALAGIPCSQAQLILSHLPSDYSANLQAAANRHPDLVVAGSFLLTDAVEQVAQANPKTHFLLVDPIVAPKPAANLLVLTFRRRQSGFLAGALAAMLTRAGLLAGVYGPGDADDQAYRTGYEDGATYVRPGITVFGAFQSAGEPYNDPSWGAAQAGTFSSQGADVIFSAGGDTGLGGLRGTAAAGRLCISSELPANMTYPSCLVANTTVALDRGVVLALQRVRTHWTSGTLTLGLAENAVGLQTFGVDPAIQQRLDDMSQQLAQGSLDRLG